MSDTRQEIKAAGAELHPWRTQLLETLLLWATIGGAVIAVALGVACYLLPALASAPIAACYLAYIGLIALRRRSKTPFRTRASLTILCMVVISSGSLFALGFDTGPVLIAFLAILNAGLLLGSKAGFAVLSLLGFVVFLVGSAPPSVALPGFLSAIGFLGVGLTGTKIVLWVVESIDAELRDKAEALAELRAERQERLAAQHALDDARQALEDARRFEASGRLAGGVAHEFNNILQVIVAWVEVSKDPSDPEAAALALKHIEKAAHQAREITGALLVVARQGSSQREPIHLAESFQRWRESWSPTLRSGVTLTLDIEPKITIEGNEAALDQAVFNLVQNAADVSVGAKRVTISAKTLDAGDIEIQVSDDGCGMDAKQSAHAFDPFYSSKKSRGSGLGLSIARGTIEQYGGSVRLQSELGAGTTLTITFPPAAAQTRSDKPTTEHRSQESGLSVLVAEDEAVILMTQCRTLRAAGCTVIEAAEGDAALDAIRSAEALDVFAVDGKMPGTPTLELARAFRARFPHGRVLVCSGNLCDPRVLDELSGASDDLLSKPYSMAAFRDAVLAKRTP